MIEQEELNLFSQSISEKSIDWLFCVELNACPAFRTWVASRLKLGISKHEGAWRSVWGAAANEDGEHDRGQTDILWYIKSSEQERIFVLIENKITAPEQKDQYLRYTQRGRDYVDKGMCDKFFVALIAPGDYRPKDPLSYPNRISYQNIAAWLRHQSDERSLYLASLYEFVIKPKKSTSEEMTLFRWSIWEIADSAFPDLNMPKPKVEVHVRDNWVEWNPFTSTPGYMLKYKMNGQYKGRCVMDLELKNRGDEVERLKERYKSALTAAGFTIEKTEDSAVIRSYVPEIVSPHFDEKAVRAALQAAQRLKRWWEIENVDKSDK